MYGRSFGISLSSAWGHSDLRIASLPAVGRILVLSYSAWKDRDEVERPSGYSPRNSRTSGTSETGQNMENG